MSFQRERGRGRGRGRGGFGGGRGDRGGPKLPAALQAEVDTVYGKSKMTDVRARKEMRKAKRQGTGQNVTSHPRPSAATSEEPSARVDKGKARATEVQPAPPAKRDKGKGKEAASDKKRAATVANDEPPRKKRKELRLPGADEDVEDAEIAWLEWALKKEKATDELDDGLDDLLDFADLLGPGGQGLGGKDEDVDDWLDEDDASDVEASESAEDERSSDQAESIADESDADNRLGEEEEDDSDVATDDAHSTSQRGQSAHGDDESPIVTPPAGAPATGRYVPPHVRAAQLAAKADADSGKAAERVRLERRSQGLLNKLSEANMDSILGDLERLYAEHSRNDVTTTLTSLILEAIASKSNLLDSFVVLYAGLVGALHRIVGIEFGAQFVQALVERFHRASTQSAEPVAAAGLVKKSLYEPAEEGKEGMNLLTLIAELYNIGVVSANLIYDLVRSFLDIESADAMPEITVERLLRVVKNCGSQLRTDDPSSLKDIVTLIQDRTKGHEKEMTTRARFMVETLVALRSGKKKEEREDVLRMRRFLNSLGKKRRRKSLVCPACQTETLTAVLATEPLRASLTDLLTADTRGKWWLVGAGWAGNPLLEAPLPSKKVVVREDEDQALLDLARKQGMNTDVRRAVFVILLTSEDYAHASDRLNALKLSDVAQRELVRVTMHCCGMAYNPYYTLVLNHLCAGSYDHRFTLQYALWDLLRELGDKTREVSRAKENVARTIAYIVARGNVDLTIFKGLDFTALNSRTRSFLFTFLRTLFVATQTPSPVFKLPKGWTEVDDEPIELAFEKTLSNAELAGGWAWVLRAMKKGPTEDGQAAVIAAQGVEVALSVVGRAI